MTERTTAPGLVQRAYDAYRVNSSTAAVALLVLFTSSRWPASCGSAGT